MKIIDFISVAEHKPWSGAKPIFNRFNTEELETLDEILSDAYPNGLTVTELNDIFWFDTDTLLEWLDIDEDEFYKREQ